MGLGFSHGDASWGYMGFMRFRNKIVNSCGLIVELHSQYQEVLDSPLKNHPIYPLIDHSDCDGDMSVEVLRTVAPALKSIVANWIDGDQDKDMGLKLVEGMEDAIAEDKPLRFK